MPNITFSSPLHKDKTIYAVAGSHTMTVLTLARENHIPIDFGCANGECSTCLVKITNLSNKGPMGGPLDRPRDQCAQRIRQDHKSTDRRHESQRCRHHRMATGLPDGVARRRSTDRVSKQIGRHHANRRHIYSKTHSTAQRPVLKTDVACGRAE